MAGLDHFGILAPFYDRVIGRREPRRLIELLGLPRGGWLLDAGGGTGRVAVDLRPLVSQVVIADETARMLTQARLKGGLHTTQARVERLPFADDVFEHIIMIDALHHVADQQHSADELWRVLKPGGRIVIEEPDIRTKAVRVVALVEKAALMRSRFLAPDQIAALFRTKKDPPARVTIVTEDWGVWVTVEKSRAGSADRAT